MFINPLSCLLMLAVSPGALAAQNQGAAEVQVETVEGRIERLCQEKFDELCKRADFPGGSLALVLPGGRKIAVTTGVTDPEGGRALTPKDRLLSGSIGKTYVAAMALELAGQGKLDLDAQARSYFEGEDWFGRIANSETVTVRQLLRHESGIARYVFAPEFWEVLTKQKDKVWEPKELLAYVFDQKPFFAPGEGWAYADTNYIIVGMILEKLSGETMYDYVQTHFLKPNKLTDTVPSNSRTIPGLIQGHTQSFKQFGLPDRVIKDGVFTINPQFEWCGGGFCNTPMDLAKWARIYYSGRASKVKYLQDLLNTVPANPRHLGPNSSYGPGLIRRETPLGELRGHDGTMTGYASAMGWFPDLDLAIAIQLNMDGDRTIGKPLPVLMIEFAEVAVNELGLGQAKPTGKEGE